MASRMIHAIYNDDDILLQAVKDTRKNKYRIEEVYIPFHIHGLEDAMGLAPTRLAITAFIYGVLGFAVAVVMVNYMMITDWPQDIGGKPSFSFLQNLPSFVPIIFELTVFFAAHLMVITFYLRSKLWPFRKPENPDPRTTDDHFLMEIEVANHDVNKLSEFLYNTGAVEIKLIEKEEDK